MNKAIIQERRALQQRGHPPDRLRVRFRACIWGLVPIVLSLEYKSIHGKDLCKSLDYFQYSLLWSQHARLVGIGMTALFSFSESIGVQMLLIFWFFFMNEEI